MCQDFLPETLAGNIHYYLKVIMKKVQNKIYKTKLNKNIDQVSQRWGMRREGWHIFPA
jgi:hypothetical protein